MLDPQLKTWALRPNLAAFSFHLPSGRIATHMLWVDADDEHLVINTEVHREKFKAMERDPNVTITIINRDDPHRYVEVRGRAVSSELGETAREHIDKLSMQYHGIPYRHPIVSERVIVRILPESVRFG